MIGTSKWSLSRSLLRGANFRIGRICVQVYPAALQARLSRRVFMVRMLAGLVAALFLMTAPAQADGVSRLDEIQKRGTLRVGMTGDYLPFSHLDKATSKFSGFDVDVAETLGKALGVKIEYVQTAWPRLAGDFEADNFDIAMGGVSITPDRQKKGIFSTSIMRDGKTPIARCADKGKYQTIADIDRPGTRIIVNPGGTNER